MNDKETKKTRLSTEMPTGRDFIILLIMFFISGMVIGDAWCRSNYQEQAIKHQAAHYDSQTGDFTWNQ